MSKNKQITVFHKKEECAHKDRHPKQLNLKSAKILFDWLMAHGYGHNEFESEKLVRITSLCEFGGVQFKKDWNDDEFASGTWAVCHGCSKIHMCGYLDQFVGCTWKPGIHPRKCNCGRKFSAADYFQPVYARSATLREAKKNLRNFVGNIGGFAGEILG